MAKRYTNMAGVCMPEASNGRLKRGINPKEAEEIMASAKPCSLFIGYSFLVDGVTSLQVDEVIVGLVDELKVLSLQVLSLQVCE